MTNFERHKKEILDYLKEHENHFCSQSFENEFNIESLENTLSQIQDVLLWGFKETGSIPETHEDFKNRLVEAGKLISLTCREHAHCKTCPLRDPSDPNCCCFDTPPQFLTFENIEKPWSAVQAIRGAEDES